ncbi:hypothetical protein V8E53_014758 [Lactarius tabidus]|jgi:hypothetical protein
MHIVICRSGPFHLNLRALVYGRNRLEDGSLSTWAETFVAHGTLVEVRMLQNAALEVPDRQDKTLLQPGDYALAAALFSWRTYIRPTLARRSNRLPRTFQLQNKNIDNGTVSVVAGTIGTPPPKRK